MFMGERFKNTAGVVVFVLILIVFGLYQTAEAEDFTVVTTFTILEDFAGEVVGNNGDVRVISPIGAEVHEWELVPSNFVDLEQADIVFYNGLNVEQWMGQVRSVVGEDVPVIAVGEKCGYQTLPIVTGEYAGAPDPHIWMDAMGAVSYVETIRDKLIKYNPEREAVYVNNAAEYINRLKELHDYLYVSLSEIAEEDRILISTEAAFLYMADAYGFMHDGVWGTNTEEEGTPGQIRRIIEVIEEKEPKGIFWESTGSDRYVLSISDDTGVPVYGPLYVDSVDEPGSKAESYIDMMVVNAELLKEVLGYESADN